MKLVKMSLAAAMLMGASAYAVENVKVSGDAKVIYQTTDTDNTTVGLFDKEGAAAGVGLRVGVSADLSSNMKGTVQVQSFDTLGLEGNLVNNVMATGQVDTMSWASQANIAINLGNTTIVAGRQELDTPLAFTEKWNVVNNTFDAAVIVNSDIPNTTLVGAYVGKGNGGMGGGGQVATKDFVEFGGNGAYAVGAVFAGIPNNTLQGWYYNVQDVADAYWLQLDGKIAAGDVGVSYGVQYAGMDAKAAGTTAGNAYAVKVGVDVVGVHVFAAYSDVSNDTVSFANVATADKTKLYTGTASIYADGANVAAADTEAYKLGVKGKVGSVDLGANYTAWELADTVNSDQDCWDVSAGTTVAGIGLKAIYTAWDRTVANNDLSTLRFIVSAKF